MPQHPPYEKKRKHNLVWEKYVKANNSKQNHFLQYYEESNNKVDHAKWIEPQDIFRGNEITEIQIMQHNCSFYNLSW